jgi:tRNA (guanine26-N2/guanine27-N2)-dimethyltransferase
MIKEGLTKLDIPKDYLKKTHFFNPKVELSRDITVLVLNSLDSNEWIVCDALSAIGARGIRIAKECDVKKVWLNDISEDNIKFMKKNARLNSVKNKIVISNKDANQILSDSIRVFDYIDLDPYGSPSYFFDSSARAIKREGFLGFTATDTAALCGNSPITCLRRYGIESYLTDFFKELGLRILIANAAFYFSKWSFSLEPLLSYTSEHYFRVFCKVEKGKSIASNTLKNNLGYVNYCPKCLWRSVDKIPREKCEFCNSSLIIIGKTWIDKIEDAEFIHKCSENLSKVNWLNNEKKIRKLLFFLKKENTPFYYDIHRICQKHKLGIPKFSLVQDKLREGGYIADRTHFSVNGIKTDATLENIIEIIKKIQN